MRDDVEAFREMAEASDGETFHTILHYLYVPSSKAALTIAEELKRRGFRTEERLAADGENWLVLARHEVVPNKEAMAATRRFLEGSVATVGGEYDGWEADVRRPRQQPSQVLTRRGSFRSTRNP
jgi:hypothetical protein